MFRPDQATIPQVGGISVGRWAKAHRRCRWLVGFINTYEAFGGRPPVIYARTWLLEQCVTRVAGMRRMVRGAVVWVHGEATADAVLYPSPWT